MGDAISDRMAGPREIGERLAARCRAAADAVFLRGAAPWEIDEAMVAFGYAVGPYEEEDRIGLDVTRASRVGADGRLTREGGVTLADRMLELGKLGRKTGAGWYRYPGGGGKVEDPIVADLGIEEARFAGLDRRDFDAEEIAERLVLAMVVEAAEMLGEGAAAARIDRASVAVQGFPDARGGLLTYADGLGARVIVERLDAFARDAPEVWGVGEVLRDRGRRRLPLVGGARRA